MWFIHLILWCALFFLPSIFPRIRDFSNKLFVCIRWPKYWNFSFSISPSSEYSAFIYWIDIIDWFDLLAVQVTFRSIFHHHQTSLVAQTVKRLPTMRETWVQSLDQEDLLKKEMANHSSILAWKIPWTEEPGRLQSMRPQKFRWEFTFTFVSITTVWRHQFLWCSKNWFLDSSVLWFTVQLLHPYMTTGKIIVLTIWTFVSRVMSLLFNTLSKFIISFLTRSDRLLISWQYSSSAVILESKRRKSVTTSTFSLSICHAVMGPDTMILVFFLMFSLKSALSLYFTIIKRLFSSSSLSANRVVSSKYMRLLMFLLLSWFQLVTHPTQHFSWCAQHTG